MSHRKISAALSSQLKTLPSLPPVAWENAPFAPVEGTLYLRESYMPANTIAVGIETTSNSNFAGLYQVSVMAELDDYKLEAQTMADSIAAHFARGTVMIYEGQSVRVETVSIAPAIIGGGWYHVPITIDWRSFA